MSAAVSRVGACARCKTPLETGDLRCAICGCAAPPERDAPARAIASILRCERCGAAVAYSAEAQGARCGFCASVMRLEQPADPIEAAEWVLPFRVDPRAAQEALRAWMRGLGWFRPSDLATQSTVDAMRPLYWAAWVFDARALVSWTADTDLGAQRSRWAPHAGQTSMRFASVLVPASRGLSHDECTALTGGYDLATAAHAPNGPSDAVVERFDVQRSAARAIIARAIEATAAAALVGNGHVPGSTYRNLRVAALVEALDTKRVCLPAFVLAYRYKGSLYRVIVHGQDPRRVMGTAPVSAAKIALLVLAGIAVVVAIAVILVALARR